MTHEEIKKAYQHLNFELERAIITFERKDTIKKIREQMLELQKQCDHSSYCFNKDDEQVCEYCGKKRGN